MCWDGPVKVRLTANLIVVFEVPTLGCLIQGGGWGGNPSKKLINGGVLINGGGGQKFAKIGFLRYLLETSAITTGCLKKIVRCLIKY